MSDIKDIVNTLVKEFVTNDKLKMDFEHHVQVAKMYPGGIDKYFLELRFEHYKKIDQNLIGNNWIQRKCIDPFSRMENTDETWIEFVVNTSQKKYDTKNDSDLIEGLDFAAELEITVFLREYFHIQQIDNYLDSFNKTEDSKKFSDKEKFIDELKEATHGTIEPKGLTQPEIAMICIYSDQRIDYSNFEEIQQIYNKKLTSKKIVEHYNRLEYPANRTKLDGNYRTDKKRLRSHLKVIEYLQSNGENITMAKSEYDILDYNIKKHYKEID